MLQQHTIISSSTPRLQTRSSTRCLARTHAIAVPRQTYLQSYSLAQLDAPSAVASTPAASWPQQQQQQQQQQQRCRVAAAAAKKQAARSPAGKGFGNPDKLASKVNSNASRKCPCGSGQLYPACCGRYHSGAAAPTPEALLRARFSAYSMQQIDYLVSTTHTENAEYTGDPITYAKSVQRTARMTEFLNLKVLGPPDTEATAAAAAAAAGEGANSRSTSSSSSSSSDDAFLRFTVRWRQRGVSGPEELATETSHFKKVNGNWMYYAAQ